MQAAAFYRVEGTLVGRPTLAAAGYLAANAQEIGQRFARLGQLAAAAPLALAGELAFGSTATKMAWAAVRGISEDRLHVLGREYYEERVEPELLQVGLDLITQSKKRGHRIVLISDSVDLVIAPLKERVGADELVCNRLEFKKGAATGRLLDPVISGQLAGQWARAFAAERAIDLAVSCAYGARAGDSLLLSAIGQPCAVNPDRQLRRIARDQSWPVVDG